MALETVAAVAGVSGPGTAAVGALDAVSQASRTSAAAGTQSAGSSPVQGDFAAILGQVADGLAAQQSTADDLAVQAVTGQLDDAHDYTIAATQAQVALELTATLRDKAVEAFNEIMRMQA
ncbi:MAG: flagellar hook-basal body complex protein FliE [Actinomyces sp.]|jgi:flagellar hook-basal body complex protein FliE|nr:flagellar hook-basal body complex protein FliE [Actinomyces sp.]MCI1641414.1 flagellar hook-basal body complex protein FliE [Actinomyces sp.]MCI1662296.1 flagellar hook-basal body complex protein FliE [Actinomyces sp.]MCI1691758.1 flagellar hook-basal body complex protein FliE [Actinomyces sp.]MCI1787442.1 flagellar hook-basal body complex protein FliE [Actinomyces sp.]MCI1830925.1 flagellar hook-basal body complex protein FliE [Actinomyces sp.]